jgi:AhpD family alkylhydroperoxidase
MSHYHDEKDLSFLQEMSELSPEEFKAWLNLDRIVGRDGGQIPRKYRELIALAVAFTTQCPYCVEVHTKAAKLAGVSREELSETAFLAAALRAGMVRSDRLVKVLDFGLAKLTEAYGTNSSDPTLVNSGLGIVKGTIAFARVSGRSVLHRPRAAHGGRAGRFSHRAAAWRAGMQQ